MPSPETWSCDAGLLDRSEDCAGSLHLRKAAQELFRRILHQLYHRVIVGMERVL